MTGEQAAMNGSEKSLKDVLDVNLYSRQIYALGQTAMVRLRSANVLVAGLGSVGVEVAKNLVLGGVRHVTLHDRKKTTEADLAAQFYLHESDVGKNRAAACFQKVEELNDSVTCTLHTDVLTKEFIKKFDVMIVTDVPFAEQLQLNQWARESNTLFISSDTAGLFGYVFNDLGDGFRVDDIDGEQPREVWLEFINTVNGDVSTLDGSLHGFESGDHVEFVEVKGCDGISELPPIEITIKTKNVFNIGDVAQNLPPYVEGGRARQVKKPVDIKFKSLKESLADPTFLQWDFMKFESPNQLHILYQALYKFVETHGHRPAPYHKKDLTEFISLLPQEHSIPDDVVTTFCYTSSGNLQPIASVLGGIAAQEVMKAITHHTTPLNGFLYIDNIEALPEAVRKNINKVNEEDFKPRGSRYDGQAAVFGWDFIHKIHKFSLFVVGAGAIGCELLKNYAMMGIATDPSAKIKITDMDQIEVSNLNRQFLFRRHDVGGKKSECAAKAVKKFNKNLNIEAIAERVAEDTEEIFNDDYFEELDCVTNALDNVDARRYMDRRCIYYCLPLLESGTMGTKGNTQVVYPHLTESYGSTNDPPEKDIPICTLKNFPYEIQHTIQWARDTFVGLFTNPAETTNQFVADERSFMERIEQMNPGQRIEVLRTVKKCLVDEKPNSAEDCVKWARELFQDFFHNQIGQLLHNFPEDQVTSQGTKFWSGTKRCPHVLDFDVDDATHFEFVYSAAILRAQQYGLKPILDKEKFAHLVTQYTPEPFVPQSGLKIAVTDEEAQAQENGEMIQEEDTESLINSLKLALARLNMRTKIEPIDFEKDDDTNHHMEFVTACSNLRAANYNINSADLMHTKQIAGRIIPALATTTSVVAGLVAIELYKIIDMKDNKDAVKSERFKCGFVNLALPLYAFSEPVGAPKKQYGDNEFTLWDRIEIDGPMTLQELIKKVEELTGLSISMVSSGVSLLYAFFQSAKARERLKLDVVKAVEDVSHSSVPKYRKSIVFEVSASNEADEDVETPYIKYNIR